ncbi:MAG: alpha/beta hydrolase [Pirellulaceae bacterium]
MLRYGMACFGMWLLCGLGSKGFAAEGDESLKITADVVYGHKHGMALTMDVYQPKDANGAGAIFMVSGGWYSIWAPPEKTMGFFKPLLDAGYTVFAVRHGSSPKFVIPEIVQDVRRSVRFVRLHAKEYGVDANKLGVCGGSAGGHLSLYLATTADDGDPDAADEVDKQSCRVAAAVAYFPPTDLRPYVKQDSPYRTNFPALQFEEEKADGVSPLLQVSSDDAPSLMIHGDKDELVPLWHSEKMEQALEEQNVATELIIIKDAAHGFGGEDAKTASDAWVAWFDRYLLGKETAASAAGE